MEREDIDKILDEYLSEYHKKIITEEIERLNKGYCELKEKCNRGECDCTNEEYNNMCEANIKLENEVERLKTKYVYRPKTKFREVLKLREEIERLNKVLKYLELYFSNREDYELAQLIRDTKEANIEWLDKAIGSDKE